MVTLTFARERKDFTQQNVERNARAMWPVDAVDGPSMGTGVRCIAPVALPGQRPQRKDTRYPG